MSVDFKALLPERTYGGLKGWRQIIGEEDDVHIPGEGKRGKIGFKSKTQVDLQPGQCIQNKGLLRAACTRRDIRTVCLGSGLEIGSKSHLTALREIVDTKGCGQ